MFNGVVKGKIKARHVVPEGQNKDVLVLCVLEVHLYQFGQKQVVLVEAWLPTYLKARKDFLMKDETKYLTFVLDGLVDVSDRVYDGKRAVMAGLISQIYIS